jgi:predicted PurR-regulated permease PerM
MISAQVGLGLTLGWLGLVLATPLTAVALVMMKMLYVEDTLGDRVELDVPEEAKSQIQPSEDPA